MRGCVLIVTLWGCCGRGGCAIVSFVKNYPSHIEQMFKEKGKAMSETKTPMGQHDVDRVAEWWRQNKSHYPDNQLTHILSNERVLWAVINEWERRKGLSVAFQGKPKRPAHRAKKKRGWVTFQVLMLAAIWAAIMALFLREAGLL